VTKFLLERAQANYVAILELAMKDNKYFKEFFKNTYQSLLENDFRTVLCNQDIWVSSVENDFKEIYENAFLKYISQFIVDYKILQTQDTIDNFLNFINTQKISIDGILYPLNAIPIVPDDNVKETINLIYLPFFELQFNHKNLLKKIDDITKNNKWPESENKVMFINECIAEIRLLKKLHEKQINDIINNRYYKNDNVILEYIKDFRERLSPIIEKFEIFITAWEKLEYSVTSTKNSTYKISKAITFISSVYIITKNKENLSQNTEFLEFKKYVLFFGQVADASNRDEIYVLLNSIALPPVSFMAKRDGRVHILINSYIGYSCNLNYQNGMVGLIDIELSFMCKNNFVTSIFVSPLDFTNPIVNELNNGSEEFKYLDVFSISYGISFGLKKLPIAIGIKFIPSQEEFLEQIMPFIGIDLPLFPIY
jgi:hypothetical protein